MPDVRIGISGWRYPPWRGVWYPKGLPQRRELEYSASRLATVEINGTFYSLQKPEYFRDWAAQVPEGFVFSVKGPRFVTHMKKLRDVEVPVANFFASGVLALRERLGPVLWQLPPNFGFDGARLDDFLASLPRTTVAAGRLAKGHDERLDGRSYTGPVTRQPLRHAVEFRHDSFKDHLDVFARHDVAVVVADTAGKWPLVLEQTASTHAYVRLHGDAELYTSGYTDAALRTWADRIAGWRDSGRDVAVHFDNDVKVHAPYDAVRLAELLGATPPWAADPAG
ncbi:DUF72 domain-containing protein [Jatrophihabitans sp. YIM 134969]